MDIEKKQDESKLFIKVSGRLDTQTSPQLEECVKGKLDGITELKIDMADLEYISSAGLRVLLMISKIMKNQGSFVICNINETVKEVFDVTGFSDILTVE
ncbi:MAG: STAS domain-containing protein [Treponema sp.]|jgi:anti-sigma B factor antagonist|nr:STAS domain-containing protein [Treponema sp.]